MNKIKSVEKGWGEDSVFFFAWNGGTVDEIKLEDGISFPVYRGYKEKRLVFEMGVAPDVTVIYFTD
jgi:hypothetical protein